MNKIDSMLEKNIYYYGVEYVEPFDKKELKKRLKLISSQIERISKLPFYEQSDQHLKDLYKLEIRWKMELSR